jgi:hypothetical protein
VRDHESWRRVCNPAKTEDEETLRVEVKRRWPDADVMWLPTTVEDPGAGQAAHAWAAGWISCWCVAVTGPSPRALVKFAGSAVAMALIPTGTGNLLMRHLGMSLDLGGPLDVAAGGGAITWICSSLARGVSR